MAESHHFLVPQLVMDYFQVSQMLFPLFHATLLDGEGSVMIPVTREKKHP